MAILKWAVGSFQESDLIDEIAERAVALAQRLGVDYRKGDAILDITAVHLNSCPLDLAGLAKADEHNFAHDVFGIRRHLNRDTAELGLCFRPRYAKGESDGE